VNQNIKISNPKNPMSESVQLPKVTDPSKRAPLINEGIRLIKAFIDIKDGSSREKLIRFAEDLAKTSS
jgi:hypothetical protein